MANLAAIDVLLELYFAQAFDVAIQGEQVPDTSAGNRVRHFLDGYAYFGAIRQEMASLLAGGVDRFFYFTNWWLGLVDGPQITTADAGVLTSAWAADAAFGSFSPFKLDDGTGGPFPPFIDELAAMSKAG